MPATAALTGSGEPGSKWPMLSPDDGRGVKSLQGASNEQNQTPPRMPGLRPFLFSAIEATIRTLRPSATYFWIALEFIAVSTMSVVRSSFLMTSSMWPRQVK